ncbi:MAG: ABC transporter substrate-binding protein [Actinobacteria bacterium]|nr:ABC transporter substrate-binding protein [Actinomycetota bacterium]
MKIRYAVPALVAVTALALTGCTNDDSAVKESSSNSASVVSAEEIMKSGVLIIGTDAEYPPNEFKDADGNPTGWGVELANAVAEEMGLEPEWQIMPFEGILPRIEEGAINMGSSSFTDNAERQKTVDFVNFLDAGSMWAAPVGSNVNPDDACGLTIAVQADTVQHTDELPAKSKACEDAGKPAIEILPFDGQPAATTAVVQGQADAFSADFPVTVDAVNSTDGVLETVGEMFDAAPYGFAVQKGSGMDKAVQKALQTLMDNGTYLEILTKAGFEAGAITEATINAGK